MSAQPSRSLSAPRLFAVLVLLLFLVGPLSVGAEEGDIGAPAPTVDATTAPAVPGLAPDGSVSLAWLAQAEAQLYTVQPSDHAEPLQVHAKAPPHVVERTDGPAIELPCSPEMRALFSQELCLLPPDVLDHAELVLDDAYLQIIIDVPDNVPLTDARAILSADPYVRQVTPLASIGMLAVDMQMAHLDILAREPLRSVAERVWLDRPVQAHLDRSVPLVRADDVWTLQDPNGGAVTGTNTTIAILDTGIQMSHPDVGGCSATDFDNGACKVAKWKVFTGEACTRPCDGHGHGTHVAATAAGNGTYVGVAPAATLWGGKVLSDYGSGSWSGVIAGIEWAAQEGADVISMSLGGGCSPCDGTDPVSQAVDAATASGSLVVVAAGNSGLGGLGTPAVAKTAVTVAATDDNDALASFSSRGPTDDLRSKPDIAAPGVAICAATAAGGVFGYNCGPRHTSISGTSMATPHVSGAAALLRQQNPDWSPAELKSALVHAAVDTQDLPFEVGSGRLDAWRSAHAPFTADVAAVDFGNLGASATAARDVSFTNQGSTTQTLSFTVQDATRLGEGTIHTVATVDPASLTLAPGASGNVSVEVDLTGIGGTLQGIVQASVGNDTYRIPYTAARMARIDVFVTSDNTTLYSSHALLDDAFASVDYASGAQATFWVPPGTYHAFSYSAPSSDPSFMIRQEVTVDVGDHATLGRDLLDAELHTFQALDPKGNAVQVESGANAVRIYDADGSLATSLSYLALGYLSDQSKVHLSGLDLSGTDHTLLYAKGMGGSYAPECVKPFWTRSYMDHVRCSAGFDTAEAFLFAGIGVWDPDGSATEHTWNATDNDGPFVRASDVRHSGALPLEGAGVIPPDSWFAIIGLSERAAGRQQALYFTDDPTWGIFASAYRSGESQERVVDFRFDADLRGDHLRAYQTPPTLARLLTGGSQLASERRVFTDTYDSWYARDGLFDIVASDSWKRPHILVHKDGSFVKSQSVAWGTNIQSVGQTLATGASYQAVLTLPDIGWGSTKQTHVFQGGQATPTVAVDFAPRFVPGYPYEVTATAGDTATAVAIEFRQGSSWVPAVTTRTGSVHEASFVPVADRDVAVRVTASKGGSSVAYEFARAAREGIPLLVDVMHSDGKAALTCSGANGGSCPDIAVRLLCDGVDVRGAGIVGGATSGIELSCSGNVTVAFPGSGPYYHGAPPPDVTLTRPRPNHVYVDDVERSRSTKVQVPIDLSPYLGDVTVAPIRVFQPDDDPWVLGDLTIEFTVQGEADIIELYIDDERQATFTPDPSGRYAWTWTLEDQTEHHEPGVAQIRVQAAHRGSWDVDVEEVLLLTGPAMDQGMPHFHGAGPWASLYVTTTSSTLDVQGVLDAIGGGIEVGPVYQPYGAYATVTGDDAGTMHWTQDGRLFSSDLAQVTWAHEPVLDWSAAAWKTGFQAETSQGGWMYLSGVWHPESILATCTASMPSTCWHYAVGPLTMAGSGPVGPVGVQEGIHGAIICTTGSNLNIHHPCGGSATPPENILRRLMSNIST